jgi:hypothetical protein
LVDARPRKVVGDAALVSVSKLGGLVFGTKVGVGEFQVGDSPAKFTLRRRKASCSTVLRIGS